MQLSLLTLLFGVTISNGVQIYVSPDGSDQTGDGTSAKPYATLEFTKTAVQHLL